ncbi:MAG: NAD(P)-dependent alcohol dehydrogenase [Alphaproteobacteria bacterium]|nr:NAD(P)-dependent alcohol dehydrogenase [Alphaproteobacteria bacterium]
MQAITYQNYGAPHVLKLTELQKPTPTDNQLLIKVATTCVTAADLMMRTGKPYIGRLYTGLTKPKRQTLGFEFAGQVEAIGKTVTNFKVGDKVFGGMPALGAYAQYITIPQDAMVTKQSINMTNAEAAPLAGSAVTALNFLKLGNIKQGQKVLIYGASGGVGTYAVSIAKALGAHVTAVCGQRNFDLVKSLGADIVFDYATNDYLLNDDVYDIIFDAVGKITYSLCKHLLAKNATYLSVTLSPMLLLKMLTNRFTTQKAKFTASGMLPPQKSRAFLNELKSLMQSGMLRTVIDRSYPLEQITTAHEYVAQGHKVGNLVITIN